MTDERENAGSRKSLRTAVLLAVFLLAAGQTALHAEGAEDGARKLLAKAADAMGGEKRLHGWETRMEKGLMMLWNIPGWGTLRAEQVRLVKKPDKLKIDQDFTAYDHPFFRTYYYNGGDAWGVTNLVPGRNPRLTSNMEEFMEQVDGTVPYYLANCDTFFLAQEVPADTILSGLDLVRVGCIHEGDTVLFDLDRETNLPARTIENGGRTQYVMEDFRDVGGVKMPFHVIAYDQGRRSNEQLWNEIGFGDKLDDAMFEENRPPIETEAE